MNTKQVSEFSIHMWMISELNLKGNELIAFALIFHYTKMDLLCVNNGFIADWLGVTRCNASRIISRLEKQGFIEVYRAAGYANAYFCAPHIIARYA